MQLSLKHLAVLLGGAAVFAGCSLIDEDVRDCGKEYQLDYKLNLVTNLTTELSTALSLDTDVQVAAALQPRLKQIFTDSAHDVDLSFYDVVGDSLRLHHEQHIMNANQTSYTLYIPSRKYMHLAAANLEESGVSLLEDQACHRSMLAQPVRDTLASLQKGVFTARLPMDVKDGQDQDFDVRLYMANCASVLVLDTLNSHVKDVKVYAAGFAHAFSLADSTYRYAHNPVIRSEKMAVDAAPGTPLCFTSVTFPSRRTEPSKAADEDVEEGLWELHVLATLPDNTVTRTLISVYEPLDAGQVKILKATLYTDGSLQPVDNNLVVGVSVVLDWKSGMSHDVDL